MRGPCSSNPTPRRSTLWRAAVLALLVASACAGRLRHDRDWVASEIGARSGAAARGDDGSDLPPGVSLDDGLGEDEAVTVALWRNAAFQEALAGLGFARADVVQAGLFSNPVFSILFPLGPKQLEFALKLPAEGLLLRPKRLKMARLDADRIAERLVQSGLDLVRDVRVAWADADRAAGRVRVAEEAAKLRGRIAGITEARQRAGDASGLDVATVQAEAALAQEEIVGTRGQQRIAEARLRTLVGVPSRDVALRFGDASAAPAMPSASEEALVTSALAARPDVRAAEIAVEAGAARRGLSRWEVVRFSGIADANSKGSRGFEIGPGLDVTLPVFDWNQAGMARAEAEETRAERQLDTVRERVALDVREAHARLETASAELAVLRSDSLTRTAATTTAASAAYDAGDLSLLELLLITHQGLVVRGRELDAAAEVARARAELERSVGHRLFAPRDHVAWGPLDHGGTGGAQP